MKIIYGLSRPVFVPHWQFVRWEGTQAAAFVYDHDIGRVLCCDCAEEELKDAEVPDWDLGAKEEERDGPEDDPCGCDKCGRLIP